MTASKASAAANAAQLDAEILTLRAAKMSSFSIAMLIGKGEAWVYNRLAKLDAAAREAAGTLAIPAEGETAADALESHRAFLQGEIEIGGDPDDEHRRRLVALPPAPVRQPTPPAPSVVTRRVTLAPAPSPRALPSPVAPKSPISTSGAFRIKPVSPRIARWASHFRRARWPLAEVADLFDLDPDDLALALGEASAG